VSWCRAPVFDPAPAESKDFRPLTTPGVVLVVTTVLELLYACPRLLSRTMIALRPSRQREGQHPSQGGKEEPHAAPIGPVEAAFDLATC
jgi:hypothetical protein